MRDRKFWNSLPLVGPKLQEAFDEMDRRIHNRRTKRLIHKIDNGQKLPGYGVDKPCYGCTRLGKHPMAAVMREGELYIFFPVCERCWRDPSRRKSVIDGHFWPHSDAKHYVKILNDARKGLELEEL